MKRLKELRNDKSQSFVAQRIGISQRSYSNYERGFSEPDQKTLSKLADYFGVSVDYLLGREETATTQSTQELTRLQELFDSLSERGQRHVWESLVLAYEAEYGTTPVVPERLNEINKIR